MFIIRLIILVVLISAVVFVYRKLTLHKSRASTAPAPASMKKCSHCGIHLPANEAVEYQQHFFCSQQHKDLYLNDHRDD